MIELNLRVLLVSNTTFSRTCVMSGAENAPSGATQGTDREQWRLELRAKTARIWAQGPDAAPGSLDSTLKRNSAFIKRLRQGNIAESKDALLREVWQLNLGKYLDELIPSIPEALWRSTTVRDRHAVMEVLVALHQRFGAEFSKPLSSAMAASFAPSSRASMTELSNEQREKDEVTRLARQRVLIRGVTEYALVGLYGPPSDPLDVGADGLEWLFMLLRELVRIPCLY